MHNFGAALQGVKVEEAFLPVAAPASVIPDRKNEYYANDKECLLAIGAAMRTEYKMIVDAGFVLQLDDARAAVSYDRMVPPASFADYREWVAERIIRYARLLGRENVLAGTDCGFAQGPFYRRVHPSIMWAKLEALAEGARLASRELWT